MRTLSGLSFEAPAHPAALQINAAVSRALAFKVFTMGWQYLPRGTATAAEAAMLGWMEKEHLKSG